LRPKGREEEKEEGRNMETEESDPWGDLLSSLQDGLSAIDTRKKRD
jgi:hypothetical protein